MIETRARDMLSRIAQAADAQAAMAGASVRIFSPRHGKLGMPGKVIVK
jgi:hypothetical protein